MKPKKPQAKPKIYLMKGGYIRGVNELAAWLGCSPSHLWRIRKGHRPSERILAKLKAEFPEFLAIINTTH